MTALAESYPRDLAVSPRGRPLWTLLTLTAGLAVVTQAARPLDDPDVWWHVRLGDQVLRTRAIPDRESWSYAAVGRRWVPTSWLSDIVLSAAHGLFGWQGVRVLVVAVAILFAFALARLMSRAAPPMGASLAYAVTAVACAGYLRERPQAVSLVLAIVLSSWCERVREGNPPPVRTVAVVCWFWACLHGMWVLVPLALVLAGLSQGKAVTRHVFAAAAGGIAAAALTPVGPRLVMQPFVIANRAHEIAEWQPVHVISWAALLLVAMAVLLAQAQRSERIFAGALLCFACLAARNVAPVAVLLAPLLARRFDAIFPTTGTEAPRWAPSTLFATAGVLVSAMLLAQPDVAATVPLSLTRILNQRPGSRVLVDYDIGGLVSGEARSVSAAVDGRTDVYDPTWLHRYLQLTELQGNWPGLLAALMPDTAVLHRHTALTQQLLGTGWTVLAQDGDWALLAAPGVPS